MSSRPLLPCRQPGCGALIAGGGWCDGHRPPAWQHSADVPSLPDDWPRRRRRILARDHHRCRCGRRAEQVDHVRPRSQGGGDEDGNLEATCAVCHGRKSAQEVADSNAGVVVEVDCCDRVDVVDGSCRSCGLGDDRIVAAIAAAPPACPIHKVPMRRQGPHRGALQFVCWVRYGEAAPDEKPEHAAVRFCQARVLVALESVGG